MFNTEAYLLTNRLENLRRLKPLKCFRHLKEDSYYTYIRHVRISSTLSAILSFMVHIFCLFKRIIRIVTIETADPEGRAIYGEGLKPLYCWNRGFESRLGHGRLSLAFDLCSVSSGLCDEPTIRSEESYRVCMSNCVLSRNLNNMIV
jgi:hypothetical protein